MYITLESICWHHIHHHIFSEAPSIVYVFVSSYTISVNKIRPCRSTWSSIRLMVLLLPSSALRPQKCKHYQPLLSQHYFIPRCKERKAKMGSKNGRKKITHVNTSKVKDQTQNYIALVLMKIYCQQLCFVRGGMHPFDAIATREHLSTTQ